MHVCSKMYSIVSIVLRLVKNGGQTMENLSTHNSKRNIFCLKKCVNYFETFAVSRAWCQSRCLNDIH